MFRQSNLCRLEAHTENSDWSFVRNNLATPNFEKNLKLLTF